jgi:GT2 family glycosyltransferase
VLSIVSRGVQALKSAADRRRIPAAPRFDVLAALCRIEAQPSPPAVVIPIHNAAVELAACLESLFRHPRPASRIILINDASTDPAVAAVLAGYAEGSGVEVHSNKHNLGFTRTVNLGLQLAGRSDVVLLNSDTKVTPRWLHNMRFAAYCGDRVGTATPFSNNAGAFSAPEPNKPNPLPPQLELDEYARLITRSAARIYPGVPTGSGFCMYLRRDCLDEVGVLDAEAFPRGYGEENDFCMRASRLGWTHVIDDATLIYHVRSASFGEEKLQLMKKGRAILDHRYPDYSTLVRDFGHDRRVRRARQPIAAVLKRGRHGTAPVAPRILAYSDSTAPPAWARHEGNERLTLRRRDGYLSLAATGAGGSQTLESATIRAEGGAGAPPPAHVEALLANWFVSHAVEAAEISTVSPFGDMVLRLCTRLGIPAAA